MKLLFFIIACFVLLLSACEHSDQNTSALIRYGLANQPINFDPRYATDAVSVRINRLLYQRLVDFDVNSQAIPALAEWTQIAPLHYRFRLLQSANFVDGSKLTMKDVQATYQDVMQGKKISPHRQSLKNIKQMILLNAQELDFILNQTDVLFPAKLTLGILPAQPLEKEHPFNRQPIGSGAFKFIRRDSDNHLLLERREDRLQVEFQVIKDASVRILKLLNNELDIIQNNLSAEQVEFLKNKHRFNFQQTEGINYSYIGFNLKHPQLSDRQLRTAISFAIDRDAIIHYVLAGLATKAESFFSARHWLYQPLDELEYNPEKARTILKQLGYSKHTPLELSYKTTTNPLSLRMAAILQQQLAGIGIQLKLQSYDWGTFYNDIKTGNFAMYSLAWVGIRTPDIFRYVFHSESIPPNGANRGRLQDKMLDELLEQQEKAESLVQKEHLLSMVQQRIFNLKPYVSLWHSANYCFTQKTIKDFKLLTDGSYDGLLRVKKHE